MKKFKSPKNELETVLNQNEGKTPAIPDNMYISCPECKTAVLANELADNLKLCPKCDYHFKMNARQRIALISDSETFFELDRDLVGTNVIDFPDYETKLQNARLDSGEKEAVVTGVCEINSEPCALFVMESAFMMGSMGSAVGEKITRLFEFATDNGLPVIGFTVSGGARMQEGIVSLMQMAKTSGAVKRHSDRGLLYITVLTNPTTGGITASFAMEGDIILSEPKALICFAGPRVIEQTTRQQLPEGFQKAEFLLEKGFIDLIVSRREQRAVISRLLKLHSTGVQPKQGGAAV